MKRVNYQSLESIGTVMWLITDFIWMNGYCLMASIFSIPTFFLMVGACINFIGKKKSELFVLTASAFWFLMNMLWIFSDTVDDENYKYNYLIGARVVFFISLIFVYLAFKSGKTESTPTDFKRLKINK